MALNDDCLTTVVVGGDVDIPSVPGFDEVDDPNGGDPTTFSDLVSLAISSLIALFFRPGMLIGEAPRPRPKFDSVGVTGGGSVLLDTGTGLGGNPTFGGSPPSPTPALDPSIRRCKPAPGTLPIPFVPGPAAVAGEVGAEDDPGEEGLGTMTDWARGEEGERRVGVET